MTDGIIFDVDGTLWNTTDIVAVAYTEVIEHRTGKKTHIDGARIRQLFGKPMSEIFEALLPDESEERRAQISAEMLEVEEDYLNRFPIPVYPGMKETFAALSEKLPLFIVSNCQCGYIEQFMRLTDTDRYVTDHLCFGETGLKKSETIRMLMERNQLKSPVYVGDTDGDHISCQEAGIRFVFASYGFGNTTDPDYRITALPDLTKLF